MQAELVIKNGLVILETGEVITDVAVQGGKIVAIGQDLSGERVIDATGLVVSPGDGGCSCSYYRSLWWLPR